MRPRSKAYLEYIDLLMQRHQAVLEAGPNAAAIKAISSEMGLWRRKLTEKEAIAASEFAHDLDYLQRLRRGDWAG